MALIRSSCAGGLMLYLALSVSAQAQVSEQTMQSISTPDTVETRIVTLDFKDGMPSKDTIAKVYYNLDFTHAFEAFVNTFQGVSIRALHKGLLGAGVKDNEVLVFSTARLNPSSLRSGGQARSNS